MKLCLAKEFEEANMKETVTSHDDDSYADEVQYDTGITNSYQTNNGPEATSIN